MSRAVDIYTFIIISTALEMMKNIFAVLHMRHFAMGVHSVINRQFFYIYIKQF